MNEKLDNKFCKEFPTLYADRYADMKTTCMCWGFECDDGWADLLYRLSEKLEPLCVEQKELGNVCKASQVKEKFGTLRFYMFNETDEMSKLIDEAEEESATTCEKCGEEGRLRGEHWVVTLCDKHWEEYKRRFND